MKACMGFSSDPYVLYNHIITVAYKRGAQRTRNSTSSVPKDELASRLGWCANAISNAGVTPESRPRPDKIAKKGNSLPAGQKDAHLIGESIVRTQEQLQGEKDALKEIRIEMEGKCRSCAQILNPHLMKLKWHPDFGHHFTDGDHICTAIAHGLLEDLVDSFKDQSSCPRELVIYDLKTSPEFDPFPFLEMLHTESLMTEDFPTQKFEFREEIPLEARIGQRTLLEFITPKEIRNSLMMLAFSSIMFLISYTDSTSSPQEQNLLDLLTPRVFGNRFLDPILAAMLLTGYLFWILVLFRYLGQGPAREWKVFIRHKYEVGPPQPHIVTLSVPAPYKRSRLRRYVRLCKVKTEMQFELEHSGGSCAYFDELEGKIVDYCEDGIVNYEDRTEFRLHLDPRLGKDHYYRYKLRHVFQPRELTNLQVMHDPEYLVDASTIQESAGPSGIQRGQYPSVFKNTNQRTIRNIRNVWFPTAPEEGVLLGTTPVDTTYNYRIALHARDWSQGHHGEVLWVDVLEGNYKL
jgi:hypothetical protein